MECVGLPRYWLLAARCLDKIRQREVNERKGSKVMSGLCSEIKQYKERMANSRNIFISNLGGSQGKDQGAPAVPMTSLHS